MKITSSELNDDLRPEYDLSQLKVRKIGKGIDVHLEPDVAEIFSNSQAVNEALRFLIKVHKQNPLFS